MQFDRVLIREVQVVLKTSNKIDGAKVFEKSKPKIHSEKIKMVGPYSILRRVWRVATEEVDLAKIEDSTSFYLQLQHDFPAEWVRFEPDSILFEYNVEPYQEKTFSLIPLQVRDTTREIMFSPQYVSVLVRGLRSDVQALTHEDITALLDVKNLKEGDYTMNPKINMPAKISLLVVKWR